MPLFEGCSKETFKSNYYKLINEGYPKKQAFAIAAKVAKENMHKCTIPRQREIIRGKFFGVAT